MKNRFARELPRQGNILDNRGKAVDILSLPFLLLVTNNPGLSPTKRYEIESPGLVCKDKEKERRKDCRSTASLYLRHPYPCAPKTRKDGAQDGCRKE